MSRTCMSLLLLFSACAHQPPAPTAPAPEGGRRPAGHVELSVLAAEIRTAEITESERAAIKAESLRTTGSANPLTAAIGALSFGKELYAEATSTLKPKAIILFEGDEEKESEIGEGATPTWAKLTYGPVMFGNDSSLRIGIVDTTFGGLAKDKLLGICTVRGVPLLDEHDYLKPETMRCLGRIKSVAVHVRPVDLTPHPEG
jgi:hypothetical protein